MSKVGTQAGFHWYRRQAIERTTRVSFPPFWPSTKRIGSKHILLHLILARKQHARNSPLQGGPKQAITLSYDKRIRMESQGISSKWLLEFSWVPKRIFKILSYPNNIHTVNQSKYSALIIYQSPC